MRLTMKILEFTEKSNFRGGCTKNQYIGGDCLKKGWTVCRFEGGLARKRKGGIMRVFLVDDNSEHKKAKAVNKTFVVTMS